jgi:ADP-heptose:LPS heptosyltransferase
MAGAGLPDLSKMDDIRSILVVRLKALGDIVLSLPVISALRERFPEAKISYLCWGRYADALSGDTGLDEVLVLPKGASKQVPFLWNLRRRGIDLALDLLSSPRSAIITYFTNARVRIGMDTGHHSFSYHYIMPRVIIRGGKRVRCYTLESNREMIRILNLFGSESHREDPGSSAAGGLQGRSDGSKGTWRSGLSIGFPAAELETEWADEYIDSLGVDRSKLVGIVPGVTYQSKSWPEEYFIELADILIEELDLRPIIIWGGELEERMSSRIVSRVPKAVKAPHTGIAKLGALIGKLKLLVTLDSGPKHIAVIQGIPTVTLFGPTDPCIWDPMTSEHRAIYLGLPCSPCREKRCEPNRCLTGITAREVADEVADLLGAGKAENAHGQERL